MKFWRGGARGDWSLVFKNRREFAGVPTYPVPPPLFSTYYSAHLPTYLPSSPQRSANMHTSYIVRAHICTRARVSIYYTYNSLTEICENALRVAAVEARGKRETKEQARRGGEATGAAQRI